MKLELLLSIFIASLLSCQPKEKVVVEKAIYVNENGNKQTGGVDEAGGGNGVDGVPLDHFIVRDFYTSAYYKTGVEPLIEKLSKDFPELAADFYHISHSRDWYFIPVKLDIIPKTVIGSYAKTDQFALQDLNKIWIDKKLFDAMSDDNKAILIVHELIMGVFLMRFQDKMDNCIAKAAQIIFKDSLDAYKKEKIWCRTTYPSLDQSSGFGIKSKDYDLIRKVVSILISDKPDIDEVKSLFEAYKFRDYAN